MHGVRRHIVAVVFATLLALTVVTASGGVATAAPSEPLQQASIASAAQVTTGDSIVQTQTYALTPNRPDEVTVTLRYEIPDRVVSLETRIPENASVTTIEGFRRLNQTTFEWDEQTSEAVIEYRIDPTQRIEKSGPEGADGEYLTVDAGDWALIERAQTPTKWTYTGRELMQFERDLATSGPGVAGDTLVYLGDQQTYQRSANEQRFRLIVPEAATLSERPEEILASLTNASNGLRIGDRDEEVFVVAAPTGDVDWGVRGLQIGDSDLWVQDTERLDTANNVWLHEYVHTRQSFRPTSETQWVIEGSATYYAAVLTLEQNRINFTTFQNRLANGSNPVYDDVVLNDPDSWTRNANYYRGPLVAGHIDKQIRVTTDSERTLQDVVRRLNGNQGSVTQEQFLTVLERVGEQSTRTSGAELTETDSTVEMWNETHHARIFGQLPARIGYRLPTGDDENASYHVNGPYRTVTVNGTQPVELATSETLTIDTIVSNAGGIEGRYNVTLEINGTEVATKSGRIGPSDQQVAPLSHTFVTPGRYAVSIDGKNVTVLVSQPARTRVSDVAVDAESVTQGDVVVVTATVVNDAHIPAEGSVVFTRDFETVGEKQVYLPPRNTTQVSHEVRLTESGHALLSAGGANGVSVIVTPSTETPSPTPQETTATLEPSTTSTTTTGTTGESGTGFTAIGAMIALALATALGVRRHR